MRYFFLITLISISITGYAQNFDFKKDISKADLQEKVHPQDSLAEAAYIFSRGRIYYSYENQWKYNLEVENRIKIYDQSEFEGATVKIPYYKGRNNEDREEIAEFKAYVYNLDGKKVDRTKISNSDVYDEDINEFYSARVFTFPEIQDGTILEYTYTIKSPHISSLPTWYFQERIPVNYSQFIVEIPEYFSYREYTKGYIEIDKDVQVATQSYSIVYDNTVQLGRGNMISTSRSETSTAEIKTQFLKYVSENLPRMEDEDHVYNLNNYRSAIKHELLGYREPGQTEYKERNNTWGDVAKTIYDNSRFGDELLRDGYFEETIDPIIASTDDDLEKAMKIFQFVKNHMEWNELNGIVTSGNLKKSFEEKKGNVADINLMLVAMLRYANLESDPVLLSTRSHGIAISPTINGFNYVIAALRLKGQIYLFDASDPYSAPNMLHEKTMNWSGRLLTPDGKTMEIDLQPRVVSSDNINLFINLDETGHLEANMRRQMSNFIGMNHRRVATNVKKESYIELLENYYDGIDIKDHSFNNLKSLSSPLVETVKFELDDACEMVGDKIFFNPLLFLATEEQPFVSNERNYPIDFSFPKKERYIINLTIPEGMNVEWVPEDASISLPNDVGSFQYITQVKDNKIQINVTKQMNVTILPADYYLFLKEFYEILVEKENDQIILTKA